MLLSEGEFSEYLSMWIFNCYLFFIFLIILVLSNTVHLSEAASIVFEQYVIGISKK